MNCSTKVSDKPREAITLLDTTVTNSGVRFYLTLTSNTDTSAILKSSVGTKESIIDIMDQPTSLGAVELIDFDKNGSADILASYIGNVPFFMLYLFDSTTASFRRVHHFDRFPESQQLESDHSLYYSYQWRPDRLLTLSYSKRQVQYISADEKEFYRFTYRNKRENNSPCSDHSLFSLVSARLLDHLYRRNKFRVVTVPVGLH